MTRDDLARIARAVIPRPYRDPDGNFVWKYRNTLYFEMDHGVATWFDLDQISPIEKNINYFNSFTAGEVVLPCLG